MTNTKDEGNPKLECRTTLRGALGGFVTRMGIGVLYLREGEAPSPAARMPACVQRSGRHLACRRAGHPARQNERVGAHLDTTTKVRRMHAPVAELESSANPQPGKAALRSAAFPACGFWRISSRQMVVLSRCAQRVVREASGVRPIYRRFSSGAGGPACSGSNARIRIGRCAS